MSEKTYKPGNYPDLPPPPGTVGVYGWIRQNLFSSISNSLLTIISVVLLYYLIAVSYTHLTLQTNREV